MGGLDYGCHVAHIFSEGMYSKEKSTLYLSKSKPKGDVTANSPHLFSVHIKEIKKVEERFPLWRFVFLEIKEGVRARQTLSGGLELKVNPGEGKPFELFNLPKKEYKILKNYIALQK